MINVINKLKLANAASRNNSTKWYKMEVAASKETADIYIYDEISWYGIDAEIFVKELNAIDAKTIRVHLNTPGGSVFDGVAIYNALKQHKATVETYVEGLAASIGSVIAMAGDKIYMADNAFFMIHDPFVLTIGNAAELRKTADFLDKIKDAIVNTYKKTTGKDEKQIRQWMQDETWFTAKEAKDAGFITDITDQVEAENSHDLSIFDNPPADLLAAFAKHSEEPEKKNQKKIEQKEISNESLRMQLDLETVE
jgi:ATP-dependent Clp endopeptidase proteolytic subunit ClpP